MGIISYTRVRHLVKLGMRNGVTPIQSVIAAGLAVVIALAACGSNTMSTAQAIPSSKFRPGQVWTLNSMREQPNARLTILRVESFPEIGPVVHVAVSGVAFGKGHTTIAQLPGAESAIQRSVATLERETGSLPDYAEGYRQWREAFDAGKAGVFTITVAAAFYAVTGISFPPNP